MLDLIGMFLAAGTIIGFDKRGLFLFLGIFSHTRKPPHPKE